MVVYGWRKIAGIEPPVSKYSSGTSKSTGSTYYTKKKTKYCTTCGDEFAYLEDFNKTTKTAYHLVDNNGAHLYKVDCPHKDIEALPRPRWCGDCGISVRFTGAERDEGSKEWRDWHLIGGDLVAKCPDPQKPIL